MNTLTAPPDLSRAAFERVLNEHRTLTSFGYYSSLRNHDRERAELLGAYSRVHVIAEWLLANVGKIRTPNQSSYSMKHRAENALDDAVDGYVSNGELIAAALLAGYTMRTPRWVTANVGLGMAQRDIDKLRDAENAGYRRGRGPSGLPLSPRVGVS
ncbi:hypothetical protein [[Mycobacterium] zoologicum]|uniref:hypothetical protein n=1 Tax=[Mycobacterium] zoologicum TaxID=2872311 RepID=UPI001CDB193D|nr:hypothetical protein [Mycolicibacter sp. MYC101]MEB3065396.1 hypothetical protein [Mycolicibacter sp. MYC101]